VVRAFVVVHGWVRGAGGDAGSGMCRRWSVDGQIVSAVVFRAGADTVVSLAEFGTEPAGGGGGLTRSGEREMAGEASEQGVASRMKLIAIGSAIIVGAFAVGYLAGDHAPAPEAGPEMPVAVPMGNSADAKPLARLEDLLPGLETKVAADPGDFDRRLLLARTYLEIGNREKGIAALRALRRDVPQNSEAVILLANALLNGSERKEWREALGMFDEAVRTRPAVAPMARLYQGEALLKLGDRPGALRTWKDFVRTLPPGDAQRALFEERIKAVGAGG
jgi:cytochrome c-type biogenesis protein CcmH/NrfG